MKEKYVGFLNMAVVDTSTIKRFDIISITDEGR